MTVKPCLKWAGGKSDSTERILEELPEKIDVYYEPFFGGGAVFFALANERRFKRAVLSDVNLELMNTYVAIRDDIAGVIDAIRAFEPEVITASKYYTIRSSKPRTASKCAARMIFLNKCCFNGLYRVNQRRGEFNVPWNQETSWAPDYENLLDVSDALSRVELYARSFTQFAEVIGPGRVVAYLDPPYFPVSKTANFTAYSRGGFGLNQQKLVANLFMRLVLAKVHVVASNADVPEAIELYQHIPRTVIHHLEVGRKINCKGSKRGKVGELLIVNARAA